MTFTIVVAWTSEELVFDGRAFAADLGARAGTRTVRTAHAAVWKLRGTDADLGPARAFVGREYGPIGRVFSYPASERDPLGRARMSILSE